MLITFSGVPSLLHDTVEDPLTIRDEVEREFGGEIERPRFMCVSRPSA